MSTTMTFREHCRAELEALGLKKGDKVRIIRPESEPRLGKVYTFRGSGLNYIWAYLEDSHPIGIGNLEKVCPSLGRSLK